MPIEETIAWVERLVRADLIVVAVSLGALWIAAIGWSFQDVRNRSIDLLLHLAAMVLVVVFSFPGG